VFDAFSEANRLAANIGDIFKALLREGFTREEALSLLRTMLGVHSA
jgi:hypothetical protein